MIHLSDRLQTICDMVTPGSRVCDVGCDHAHVEIRLLQEGKIPSALAMDVAPGPLAKARENLELTELSDRCEVRLSDGLSGFQPGEADVLICTGMGGILMRSILEAEPEKAASFRELLLSPHTEIALVRDWLRRSAFRILEEEFLEEEEKYYTVIKAALGSGPGDPEGPDWDAFARFVRCLPEEAAAEAMIDRGQTLRLLEDPSFRRYAEDEYGPRVLQRFLASGSGGGRTQSTFLRFLTGRLRGRLDVAQRLEKAEDSTNAAGRLQQIRGEIGILQVLLFLYTAREKIGTGSDREASEEQLKVGRDICRQYS